MPNFPDKSTCRIDHKAMYVGTMISCMLFNTVCTLVGTWGRRIDLQDLPSLTTALYCAWSQDRTYSRYPMMVMTMINVSRGIIQLNKTPYQSGIRYRVI